MLRLLLLLMLLVLLVHDKWPTLAELGEAAARRQWWWHAGVFEQRLLNGQSFLHLWRLHSQAATANAFLLA